MNMQPLHLFNNGKKNKKNHKLAWNKQKIGRKERREINRIGAFFINIAMARLLSQQYGRILYELAAGRDEKDIGAALDVFVDFLKTEHAISKHEKIIAAYEQIAREASGKKRLMVTSARALSKRMAEIIASKFDGEVEIEAHVNPEILGGIIIQDKYTIFDASIRQQLQRLKEQLY